jgi:mono/diheme cytochrome c family protein
MRLLARTPSFAVTTVLLLGIAVIAWRFVSSGGNGDFVSLEAPELSELASRGKAAFDANCAACHGANGSGSDKGPPLVHDT